MTFHSLIRRYLRPDFYFVQIGAYDGVTNDPIRRYVLRHNWSGLLVEPLPGVFNHLTKNYKGRENLRFANVALAFQDTLIDFYRHPVMADCSGMAPAMTKRQKRSTGHGAGGMEKMRVRGKTWRTLIVNHGITRVDLLQMDCEGMDWQLLKSTGFDPAPGVIRFEKSNLTPLEDAESVETLMRIGYHCFNEGKDRVAYR